MGSATVPVAVVGSRIEAELIVGLLASHGLWATVSADDAGGQEPQLQLQGVRVLVASSDEESARRLLADVEDTLGPEAAEPARQREAPRTRSSTRGLRRPESGMLSATGLAEEDPDAHQGM